MDSTTFITMDTASDCHCAPTDFGEGCSQHEDAGPRVRDAQRQSIKFESVATVPMATTGEQIELLKANFRLGATVSKPILSLLEVVDNGAEVWLSKDDMRMFLHKDYDAGLRLARRHNTLGIEVKTFTNKKEAKQYAGLCAVAEEIDPMDFEEHGARSAPSGLTFEERLGGAQSPADGAGPQRGGQPATGHTIGLGEAVLNIEPPAASVRRVELHEALHPDSRVDDMRARLKELLQPIYGMVDETQQGREGAGGTPCEDART